MRAQFKIYNHISQQHHIKSTYTKHHTHDIEHYRATRAKSLQFRTLARRIAFSHRNMYRGGKVFLMLTKVKCGIHTPWVRSRRG